MLLGDQEDIEIRPDRAADVGREEIQELFRGSRGSCVRTMITPQPF